VGVGARRRIYTVQCARIKREANFRRHRPRRPRDHLLLKRGAADTSSSSTVMARTVLQALAVCYCCCAMAASHPSEIPGGNRGGPGDDTTVRTFGRWPEQPSAVSRNKRWSTTFGANSGNKNATSKSTLLPSSTLFDLTPSTNFFQRAICFVTVVARCKRRSVVSRRKRRNPKRAFERKFVKPVI